MEYDRGKLMEIAVQEFEDMASNYPSGEVVGGQWLLDIGPQGCDLIIPILIKRKDGTWRETCIRKPLPSR
jgi:hypothetical protein